MSDEIVIGACPHGTLIGSGCEECGTYDNAPKAPRKDLSLQTIVFDFDFGKDPEFDSAVIRAIQNNPRFKALVSLLQVTERMLEDGMICPCCNVDKEGGWTQRPGSKRPVRASDHDPRCDLYNALAKAREP